MCPGEDLTNAMEVQDRTTPEVRQTVGLVQSQLKQLLQQRAAIVKRIAMIRRTIVGLNTVFADFKGGGADMDADADTAPESNMLRSDRGMSVGPQTPYHPANRR
jgi:hypothetical protein